MKSLMAAELALVLDQELKAYDITFNRANDIASVIVDRLIVKINEQEHHTLRRHSQHNIGITIAYREIMQMLTRGE